MKTFKVGDLVYCPKIGVGVYILERNDVKYGLPYELKINIDGFVWTFTEGGSFYIRDAFPALFEVTEKNRKRLSKLYGVDFD